jgi:diaminopimelate decarboxylase
MEDHRTRSNGHYYFSGHDTTVLAKKYGTPLYVMSEDLIRERMNIIHEAFLKPYPKNKAAYASKAYLSMHMCRIVESEGFHLDVVSGGELYTAMQAEFPMEKIIFHGNNKSLDEIAMAVSAGVGRLVVDYEEEIDLIEEKAKSLDKVTGVQLRVVPEVEGKTHKHIMTGQKDSKFGLPMEPQSMLRIIERIQKSPYIDFKGFHFHIGSNLYENEVYRIAIRKVMNLLKLIKDELNMETNELNTGGGYGIIYDDETKSKPLHFFTDAIMDEVEQQSKDLDLTVPSVIIEPGRWIVGEAGITIYEIGAIKEIPGIRKYASVNGGIADNIRPALYNAKYSAVIANKYHQKKDTLLTVAGKCCESGDILIHDLEVPAVARGDLLVVQSTGAYNESMASNYNRLPRPAVVFLNGNTSKLIAKRETYESILQRERLAELS